MNRIWQIPVYRWFQFASFAVFAGRGWQHLIWDSPFRTLLWDERLLRGVIEGVVGISWQDYITDLRVDQGIQYLGQGFGILYIGAAIAVLAIRKVPRISRIIIFLGAAGLILLSLLEWKEHFFRIGHLLEHSLQWSAPLLFLFTYNRNTLPVRAYWLSKVAAAATFVGHGFYALNWHPRPGHFVQMTMNILGLSETASAQLLVVMGYLDLVAAILIFVRIKRLALAGWSYMVFWGAATAMARLWTNWQNPFMDHILKHWLPESLLRFPHFLVPLAVLLILTRPQEENTVSAT